VPNILQKETSAVIFKITAEVIISCLSFNPARYAGGIKA